MEDMQKATLLLIRTCLVAVNDAISLPNEYDISLRLYYYDNITPPDYEPEGFYSDTRPDHLAGLQEKSVKVGKVATPYHKLTVRIISNRIPNEGNDIATNNQIEVPQHADMLEDAASVHTSEPDVGKRVKTYKKMPCPTTSATTRRKVNHRVLEQKEIPKFFWSPVSSQTEEQLSQKSLQQNLLSPEETVTQIEKSYRENINIGGKNSFGQVLDQVEREVTPETDKATGKFKSTFQMYAMDIESDVVGPKKIYNMRKNSTIKKVNKVSLTKKRFSKSLGSKWIENYHLLGIESQNNESTVLCIEEHVD